MPSEQAAEPAITARGLAKAYRLFRRHHHRLWQHVPVLGPRLYREYWAVEPLDFEIARGESVAIIGRNGSGKSTLLQMLCGTTTPTRGWIETRGRIAPLLELGAGFAPEFTGRENLMLASSILGLTRSEIDERADEIIAFADLPADFIDQPVKQYSSGMYARLAFSVAIHIDADILVVDEILSVGDGAFVQKCMKAIRKFRERGTLLFVSHDTPAVLGLCERAMWLDQGQLMASGGADEVVLQYEASLKHRRDGGEGFRATSRRADASIQDPRLKELREAACDEPVSVFDPAAVSFGEGGACIETVEFRDADDQPIDGLLGGEVIAVEILGVTQRAVRGPIVGFYVQDRLGQTLFADNTATGQPLGPTSLEAGVRFRAVFKFQLPFLPTGEYAVGAAIAEAAADGGLEESVPLHWVESALTFRIHGSHVAAGLVGIPMLDVAFEMIDAEAAR
jgi:lipopolysaccharide transport system ATP-binding protein